jgi:hypothetical protein
MFSYFDKNEYMLKEIENLFGKNGENINLMLEILQNKNIDLISKWKSSQKRLQISIILGVSIVLILFHALMAFIFLFVDYNIGRIIIINSSFVIMNAIVEILFAHYVIKYQFI